MVMNELATSLSNPLTDLTVVTAIAFAGLGFYGSYVRRKNRTVSTIVSDLEKTAAKLDSHAEEMKARAARHDRMVQFHFARHEHANEEHGKARVVASNISKLIGGAL